MNNTGIIRKIDELGRIVIPKEIRKCLNIRDGENIQILLDNDKIILKKYEKLLTISEKAQYYIDSFIKLTDFNVAVVDLNKVIASNDKLIINKNYNNQINNSIVSRQSFLYEGKITDDTIYKGFISPIIVDADLLGAVIIYGKHGITLNEKTLASVINIMISSNIS